MLSIVIKNRNQSHKNKFISSLKCKSTTEDVVSFQFRLLHVIQDQLLPQHVVFVVISQVESITGLYAAMDARASLNGAFGDKFYINA
jgi:hypothetical protein